MLLSLFNNFGCSVDGMNNKLIYVCLHMCVPGYIDMLIFVLFDQALFSARIFRLCWHPTAGALLKFQTRSEIFLMQKPCSSVTTRWADPGAPWRPSPASQTTCSCFYPVSSIGEPPTGPRVPLACLFLPLTAITNGKQKRKNGRRACRLCRAQGKLLIIQTRTRKSHAFSHNSGCSFGFRFWGVTGSVGAACRSLQKVNSITPLLSLFMQLVVVVACLVL